MEIVLAVAALLLILLGCVFVFLPGLPGTLIAWLAPLVYFIFADGEKLPASINAGTLAVSGILAAGTIVFDFFSSWWGAKKFGATWRGGIGALVGAIVGAVVFSPIAFPVGSLLGLLVGPLVGAFAGEILGGNDWRRSARAGWGTLLGTFAATAVKLLYCLAIFIWMICAIFFA